MLQTEKAGTGNKEKEDPTDSPDHSKIRAKKFCRAKAEEDAGEQIRRSPDQKITNAGCNRADWSEKILSRVRRRSDVEGREPSGDLLWHVGDQSKKKQCPGSEEDQGVDFIPSVLLSAFPHRGSILIARGRLSIPLFGFRA
jgi:hypothetical protein